MLKIPVTIKLIASCWNMYLMESINTSSEACFNFLFPSDFFSGVWKIHPGEFPSIKFPLVNSSRKIPHCGIPLNFFSTWFSQKQHFATRNLSLFVYFIGLLSLLSSTWYFETQIVEISPLKPGTQGNKLIRFQDFIYFHPRLYLQS